LYLRLLCTCCSSASSASLGIHGVRGCWDKVICGVNPSFAQHLNPPHCKDIIPNIRNKYIPEIKLCGLSRNFHIHVSVSGICTYSYVRSAYSATGKYVDQSWEDINHSQTHECGNECGTKAEQLLFWEYINGIFVAVHMNRIMYSMAPLPLQSRPNLSQYNVGQRP
jgi:hypothetical protein